VRNTFPNRPTYVRWRIFALLFAFGFNAFVQQKTLTVTAVRMMPELGLSQVQIGWLETAFVLAYTAFQIPASILGQRFGARRTFVVIGLIAVVAVIATPASPVFFNHGGIFIALVVAQVLLGMAQAGIFPMSAGVCESWFPPRRWGFVLGMQTMGVQLGAAATPPLIASLMVFAGWQQAVYWTALPAVLLIVWWAFSARNAPSDHPSVSPAELTYIGPRSAATVPSRIDRGQLIRVISNRNVLLLSLSYMCMNYVFYLLANWVFLYLIQARGFSVLQSGWLASVPPLAAAIGAGTGGVLAGITSQRFSTLWGFRVVPLISLPIAALLLVITAFAANPYWAVAALAACYASIELNEAAYWGCAMTVGLGNTMAVGGVLNTGGNLGGIVGIPVVAYLSSHHMWRAGFLIGACLGVASALAWFGIDATKPVRPISRSQA
jgi:ACS family glucarate transporter-like MFS transporter